MLAIQPFQRHRVANFLQGARRPVDQAAIIHGHIDDEAARQAEVMQPLGESADVYNMLDHCERNQNVEPAVKRCSEKIALQIFDTCRRIIGRHVNTGQTKTFRLLPQKTQEVAIAATNVEYRSTWVVLLNYAEEL